jgi:hypothetical protein
MFLVSQFGDRESMVSVLTSIQTGAKSADTSLSVAWMIHVLLLRVEFSMGTCSVAAPGLVTCTAIALGILCGIESSMFLMSHFSDRDSMVSVVTPIQTGAKSVFHVVSR